MDSNIFLKECDVSYKDLYSSTKNRVAIYNRCSTEEEAQMNALENQVAESREIAEKMGWIVIRQYIESESATSIQKRLEYQRLLEDIEKNIFDIIMIKSIDRLMRSTKDWYLFIDKVVNYGIKLYIYIDNKFYNTEDSLITGIKAILAEDFSRELSKKIKNAHKRRQEKKTSLNFTVPIFGWDKIAKDTYRINEEEAMYYRLAFAMAYEGKGFYKIAKYMATQGVVNKRTGKPMSEVQWRKMLFSTRAHGTVILHTREYDFNTKKYIKIDEKEWIYIENALPPIVSREYQEMVLQKLRSKNKICHLGNKGCNITENKGSELSKKLVCGCCGKKYYRVPYNKGKEEAHIWKCSNKLMNGSSACSNINIFEKKTIQIIENICEKNCEKSWILSLNNIIEETIRIAKQALKDSNNENRLKKLKKELSRQEEKKTVLLDKLMEQVIEDQDFQYMNMGITKKIIELKEQIKIVEQNLQESDDIEERVENIKKLLQEENIIKRSVIKENFSKIEQIVVHNNCTLEIIFDATKALEASNVEQDYIRKNRESYYKVTVPYTYKTHYELRREKNNERILELLRKNPTIKLSDVADKLELTNSYVYTSIKQLKAKNKIFYKRSGAHSGYWVIC